MAGEIQQGPRLGPSLFTSAYAEALRIVFMTGHGDRAVYGGLLRTCRTGRDWVLTTAPQAHVTLRQTPEQLAGDRWQRKLHAAHKLMVVRGQPRADLSTALTVGFNTTPNSKDRALALTDSLVSFLQQAGQYISELHIDDDIGTEASASVLQRAGTGLGSLLSLTLSMYPYILPPPSQLPSLRQLSITGAQGGASFRSSVGALMSQLTSFYYYESGYGADSQGIVDIVKASGGQLDTLTELTVFMLDDALLGAVLDHCPNLARIDACRLNVTSKQHKGREWGLRQLCIEDPFWDNSDTDEHMRVLKMLARLPRLAAGAGAARHRLRISRPVFCPFRWGQLLLRIDRAKGLPKAVAQHLADWSFNVLDVKIYLSSDMDTQAQLSALPVLVDQLRDIDAPEATVSLEYKEGCDELESAVAQAVSTLSHLKIETDPYLSSDGSGFDSDGNSIGDYHDYDDYHADYYDGYCSGADYDYGL